MAMTKAEQAQMEALKVRLALVWPPEPPVPVDIGTMLAATDQKWVRLWWVNAHGGSVGEGITDGQNHARTPHTEEQVANRHQKGGAYVNISQTGGGPWYATKREALGALHYAIAQRCAKELYDISNRVAEA
jgi:hypothetical protein